MLPRNVRHCHSPVRAYNRQHKVFPRPGICTDEPLYFRRNERAFYAWSDDYITFERDGAAEFDTYFNGLSAEKLFRYTSVKKIFLKLKLNGIFRVTLMRKEKCAQLLTCEFVSETVVNSEGRLYEFSFAFDCKNRDGLSSDPDSVSQSSSVEGPQRGRHDGG